MPFATFPKRRGDMFVAVCTTPKASPSPRRPHKTWSFLNSSDRSTPPPEELLEQFLHESPIADPFADEFCTEDVYAVESSTEDPFPEDFYTSKPYPGEPLFDAACPYPSGDDAFALRFPTDPTALDPTATFSPISPPSPLSPLSTATTPSQPAAPPLSQPEQIAIVGLNPLGLALAALFSARGFNVLAYDGSEERVARIATAHAASHALITFTSTAALLTSADYFVLCVPPRSSTTTMTSASRRSDGGRVHDDDDDDAVAPLRRALTTVVAAYARPGATVVLEAPGIPVGTTRSLLANLHRYQGLFAGMAPPPTRMSAVFGAAAAAPEATEPKLISGLCHRSLASIASLYSRVYPTLITVAGPEIAEMTGLREKEARAWE